MSRPLLPLNEQIGNVTHCIAKATKDDEDDALVVAFVVIGRLVVIVLGCVQLLMEVIDWFHLFCCSSQF